MKYYIAYGSNLNVEQMHRRCPDAKIYKTYELKDYELLFKGVPYNAYLTIEPKAGCLVPVAIWEVSEADEVSLDRYEGYPVLYDKQTMKLDDGTEAFVYIMKDKDGINITIPSTSYFITCVVGYSDFSFDKHILSNAYKKGTRTYLNNLPQSQW